MKHSLGVLRRIADERRPDPGPRCEMCSETIGASHRHVVNVEGRQLLCVCRACYLLFTDRAASLRYRAVPDRYLAFPTTLGRDEWDALEVPVGLAFFFHNSALGRPVGVYPGPAGATESELPLHRWRALLDRHREFEVLADDVEALLIRMPGHDCAGACLLLPIDACYEFTGQIRLLWRGFDGGTEARQCVDQFLAGATERANKGLQ